MMNRCAASGRRARSCRRARTSGAVRRWNSRAPAGRSGTAGLSSRGACRAATSGWRPARCPSAGATRAATTAGARGGVLAGTPGHRWPPWRTTRRGSRRCSRSPPARSCSLRQSWMASKAAWSMKSTFRSRSTTAPARDGPQLRASGGTARNVSEPAITTCQARRRARRWPVTVHPGEAAQREQRGETETDQHALGRPNSTTPASVTTYTGDLAVAAQAAAGARC